MIGEIYGFTKYDHYEQRRYYCCLSCTVPQVPKTAENVALFSMQDKKCSLCQRSLEEVKTAQLNALIDARVQALLNERLTEIAEVMRKNPWPTSNNELANMLDPIMRAKKTEVKE